MFNCPICPHCGSDGLKSPGSSMTTCASFQPIYCKAGFNLNPNRNRSTSNYNCLDCGKSFEVDETPKFKNPCISCTLDCKDRRN